jgi:hypothetical protein
MCLPLMSILFCHMFPSHRITIFSHSFLSVLQCPVTCSCLSESCSSVTPQTRVVGSSIPKPVSYLEFKTLGLSGRAPNHSGTQGFSHWHTRFDSQSRNSAWYRVTSVSNWSHIRATRIEPASSKPISPTFQQIKVYLSPFPTMYSSTVPYQFRPIKKSFPPGITVEEHAQNDVTVSANWGVIGRDDMRCIIVCN